MRIHVKSVDKELACTKEIINRTRIPPGPKKRTNQSRRRRIFNLKGVAYQGAREATGLRSRGGPPLELRFVRVHLFVVVGILSLEGVILLLLPLHVHVRLVGVITGVAALLLLLLDLVL
jgi:hypothetical protein